VKREPYLVATSDQQCTGSDGLALPRRSPVPAIAYFLISGIVSLMVGAAVSLTASGTERLALWSGATATTAVAAGIAYESRLFRIGVQAFSQRRSQLRRRSPTS
jgi:hypothetical protein